MNSVEHGKPIADNVVAFLRNASDLYGKMKAEEFGHRLWEEFITIQSPIEQMFLAALYVVCEFNCCEFIIESLLPRQEGAILRCEPQFRCGSYRVDFALACHNKHPIVCVELDGHEFHDRDARQRRYEKIRDRYLVTNGFTLLHFTGSEVVKDPYAVALEALIAATKLGEVAIHPNEY